MTTFTKVNLLRFFSILLAVSIPAQVRIAHGQYGYTGQGMESSTGLNFHRLRYYDPETGIFITRDPVGQQGGLNLYSYVLANPINLVDPKGDAPILAPLLVSAGFGGVLGGVGVYNGVTKLAAASQVPEAASMSSRQIAWAIEKGSKALPKTVFDALGGDTLSALAKAA